MKVLDDFVKLFFGIIVLAIEFIVTCIITITSTILLSFLEFIRLNVNHLIYLTIIVWLFFKLFGNRIVYLISNLPIFN